MRIEIPDEVFRSFNFSEAEFRTELAMWLYEKKIMSLMQAARFASLNILEFQQAMEKKGVMLHYEMEDYETDMNTLKKIFPE